MNLPGICSLKISLCLCVCITENLIPVAPELIHRWTFQIVLNAIFSVDSFFLLRYTFFKLTTIWNTVFVILFLNESFIKRWGIIFHVFQWFVGELSDTARVRKKKWENQLAAILFPPILEVSIYLSTPLSLFLFI